MNKLEFPVKSGHSRREVVSEVVRQVTIEC
jgi:hypothetical protein